MSAPFAPSLRARLRRRAGRHGVALLLVLGCLVLLTTLILAFLISGQANLKSSKLYANGSSVKTLADSTVSLVMAQIQQATSNGTQVAWASQPGMIRTYDNTGAPLTNYRLFSWDSPTVSGAYDASTDATQLSSTPSTIVWYNSPSVFVDLNRPVNDSTGVPHYPILDGNPKDLVSYTTPAGTAASTYTINSITPGIEGFWVNLPNATGTSSMGPAVNPTTSTPSNGNTNDVPMPVKWLYVLKDGTVVAPAPSSTGSTVSIPSATSTNPIVGRIAYWTDDETAKVNINTASEGVYWDTPRADTTYERTSLANFQPAQNEFQRYPGHPATTCLSTVLGALFPVSHDGSTYTASQFMPYFTLAPKSNVGGITQNANLGSNAGTAAPVTGTKAAQTGAGALSFKSKERLYASVDELNFQSDLPNGLPSPLPGNAGVSAGSGYSRTSTANGADNVIAAADIGSSPFLEKAHFFLTADSRAPDVNLYNQPRLSIWPVSATNTTSARTGFDTTIAFCGTINKLPYYFQRQNSFDPSADLPTSYTAGDSGIGRNRQLIKYLQSVTGGTNGGVSIPGFGGDFVTKYTSSERDQILTEIFDYVRCQNLIDPNVSTPFSGTPSFGLNYLGTTDYTNHSGSGQVVPIVDTLGAGGAGTRGFGRFPTVTEADLVFIVEGWNDNSGGSPATTDPNYWSPGSSSISATSPTGSPWGYYGKATMTGTPPTSTLPNCWSFKNHVLVMAPIQPGHVRVQAALILSLFDPSQGYPANNGCYQVGIQGLDSWTWNGVTMNFPSESDALTNWPIESGSKFGYDQVKWGGIMDYRHLIMDMSPTAAKNSSQYYPFFSDSIDIPYDPTKSASATNPTPITFTAGGNPITIKVYVPTGTSWKAGTLLQTIKVTFPDGVFPCPTYAGPVQDDNGVHDMARWDVRFAQGPNPWSPQTFLFVSKGVALTQAVDVVRSVRLNTDARLVAGLQTVDASATSAPNGSYFASYTGSETTNLIHGLWLSTGMPLFGATWGQLVPGLTYNTTYSSPWTANLGNVGALPVRGLLSDTGRLLHRCGQEPDSRGLGQRRGRGGRRALHQQGGRG
ncbi:MAG: Verru_Chthon cassette protein A [Verrucomicrobiota bacterium]